MEGLPFLQFAFDLEADLALKLPGEAGRLD
jgi:hypothetical protein